MFLKSKNMKLFLRILALSCVAIFLGVNVYMWNAQSLTGNVLPMPFGVGVAVVLSGSMEPALSVNDLILVVEQESYQVGEIVVYQSSGALVVHRIIALDGNLVTTQGDDNNTPDAEMDVKHIKGKVLGHLDGLGALVRVLKSPMVTVALLIGAVLLLERSYRREKQQGDAELDQIKEEIRRLKAQQEDNRK